MNEANVEHASAKDLIVQILAMGPTDALHDAKIKLGKADTERIRSMAGMGKYH